MKKKLVLMIVLLFNLVTNVSSITAGTVPDICSIPFSERTETDGNDYSICEEYYIQTDPTSGVEVYEGEFVTSEGTYHRIYYDHELDKWFGVTHVTDYEVVDTGLKSATWINLKFSRELASLKQITLEYTSEEECEHFGLFGVCLGGKYLSEVFYEVIENTKTDGAWNENLLLHNDDIIEYTNNQSGSLFNPGDYDYTVFLHKIPLERQIEDVRIVGFDFELTDAELIQLAIDIEDQYAYEVTVIANDPNLNFNEKEEALSNLNDEYNSLPELEFGMRFSQLCDPSDSSCYMVTEDVSGDEKTIDELLNDSSLIDELLKSIGGIVALIVAGITGMSFIGIFSYIIVREGVSFSLSTFIYGMKKFFTGVYTLASKAAIGINILILTPLKDGINFIIRNK